MAGYYSKHLGPTLAYKLEQITARPIRESLQLHEEIAIARVMALETIKLAEPVLSGREDPRITAELVTATFDALRTSIDHVARLVESASRIERNAEDKVSVNYLQLFVMQITVAIHDVLGKDHIDLARDIEARIKDTVRLPIDDRVKFDTNAVLAPTTTVITEAMDALTIPQDAESVVDESSSVQDSASGTTVGEDGTS